MQKLIFQKMWSILDDITYKSDVTHSKLLSPPLKTTLEYFVNYRPFLLF